MSDEVTNQTTYIGKEGAKYLASQLLTHSGTTIAFGLSQAPNGRLSIHYSILNADDDHTSSIPGKAARREDADQLDSQHWFTDVKALQFPSEMRVVGEEAIPLYELPQIDAYGASVPDDEPGRADSWSSTTICLMNPDVKYFQVVSDGKYVYVFRQSRAASDVFLQQFKDINAPAKRLIDSSLLCDRFMLVGASLNRTLEVRFRRSRQKRIPLNNKDTLAVRDINERPFYEPTFSVRFVDHLFQGRFNVLQTPTAANDVSRWNIFAASEAGDKIDVFSIDVSDDGMFDIHGKIYYTCDNEHKATFTTASGTCAAIKADHEVCGRPRKAVVPKSSSSNCALSFNKDPFSSQEISHVDSPRIDLSAPPFAQGYTLEAWIKVATTVVTVEQTLVQLKPIDANLEKYCPYLVLTADHTVALKRIGHAEILVATGRLRDDGWNHVALKVTTKPAKVELLLNGEAAAAVELPADWRAGFIERLVNQTAPAKFVGALDEIRLWSLPLDAAMTRARMTTRCTGLEPYLEALWHLDEGLGLTAFDATSNGRHLTIHLETTPTTTEPVTFVWYERPAPMLGNVGLTKTTLRMKDGLVVSGGLGAALYYEQVSVMVSSATKDEQKRSEAKPMKRGARVLLCLVAKLQAQPDTLAVIDFGIISDGTFGDTPPVVPLPPIAAKTHPTEALSTLMFAPTSPIHIDPMGVETFGGRLAFDAARCSVDSPVVWSSATGSVTIYYRNATGTSNGAFSALTYDVSRKMQAGTPASLKDFQGIVAAPKMRQAKSLTVSTTESVFDGTVAVDLDISATITADGTAKTLRESWQSVPASIEKLCDLVNGRAKTRFTIGALSETLDRYEYRTSLFAKLKEKLKQTVEAPTCLDIGGWRFFVKETANVDDAQVMVYGYSRPGATLPNSMPIGTSVDVIGYDYTTLVKTMGKQIPDYTQGSALVSMAPAPVETTGGKPQPTMARHSTATLTSDGDAPFFGDSKPSTSLLLKDNITFSMHGAGVRTVASPGLTFEGWIKATKNLNSVIVAYTSERSAISPGMPSTYQTFVLAVSKVGDSTTFQLLININGRLLTVEKDSVLHTLNWFHFAATMRNAVTVAFDKKSYVDFGNALELNVANFSVTFTLCLTEVGRDQVILAKTYNVDTNVPIRLDVTAKNQLKLTYHATNETGASGVTKEHQVVSSGKGFELNTPYKVLVSRAHTEIKKDGQVSRWAQVVTMRAWDDKDVDVLGFGPPEGHRIVDTDLKDGTYAEACGPGVTNTAALLLGGLPWSPTDGLTGSVGMLKLYSEALPTPKSYVQFSKTNTAEPHLLGSWTACEDNSFVDDCDRNHGKFRKEPKVVVSPFPPDHRTSIYLNGIEVDTKPGPDWQVLKRPPGPHQLTLGNVLHPANPGDTPQRYFLLMSDGFDGELDEFRLWNVPRTRNNIADTMNERLSEAQPEMAVYLPFDLGEKGSTPPNSTGALGILRDQSENGWHLTPLFGENTRWAISQAPVGKDAACVQHTYGDMKEEHTLQGAQLDVYPSVTEYSTMQTGAMGSLEGSFKRAYSYVDKAGKWHIVTGYRIGALITEWVSQMQTSPTLIGYIEGAPPVPAENFLHKEDRPWSSIKFANTQFVQYSYGLRTEKATETNVNFSAGAGAEWKVSAGVGVETEVSSGKEKGFGKFLADVTDANFNNNVSTIKAHTNIDVKMDLTGVWWDAAKLLPPPPGPDAEKKLLQGYNPANTGLALVESEVADVFALRLKTRGAVAPLVAYQVRPNPDIPKDRNLVSFPIHDKYTKQGCLDGRRGEHSDPDYASTDDAPKDASYYKPAEAYALKDRIRRAEEQLAGEFDRYQVKKTKDSASLLSRTRRNICNSYVWTADGGTFQETHQMMDFVQQEVGGNNNSKVGGGGGYDIEMSLAGLLLTCQFDAVASVHTNVMQTKDKQTEMGFELIAELPPPISIVDEERPGGLEKRRGAVDCYRWMSFWLEPSAESTDAFFKQVIDDRWLAQSPDPSAALLRSLKDKLDNETGNARTKAWRLFHRVTYVSRVLDTVRDVNRAAGEAEKKTAVLPADIACNWRILQTLEPLVRAQATKQQRKDVAVAAITARYPAVAKNPLLMSQLLQLISDYLGLDMT